jgi:hypothetical protein
VLQNIASRTPANGESGLKRVSHKLSVLLIMQAFDDPLILFLDQQEADPYQQQKARQRIACRAFVVAS